MPIPLRPTCRTARFSNCGRTHERPAKGAALAGTGEKRISKRWLIDLMLTAACWAAAAALIALRLTDQIHWLWWWLIAPLWAPVCAGLGGFATLALFERFRSI